jgi:hypothetical protein
VLYHLSYGGAMFFQVVNTSPLPINVSISLKCPYNANILLMSSSGAADNIHFTTANRDNDEEKT